MLKYVGAILTICSGGAIGLYFSAMIKLRLESLREIKKNMINLRGEIQYAGTPLPEAFYTISVRCKDDFRPFFHKVSDKLLRLEGLTLGAIWNACVKEELSGIGLKKEDLQEFIYFGESIGYLDKKMQISTIDLYLTHLQIDIDELAEEIKTKIRLYNLLGIMSGIFVTIVLI